MNKDVSKHTLSRSAEDAVEYQFTHKECMLPFIKREHKIYIEGQLVWVHTGARNLIIFRDAYTKEGVEIDLAGKKWDKTTLKFDFVFKKDENGLWYLKN